MRHHVSTIVLALGGVLGCLEGSALAAPPLAAGTVPIKWSNGVWSTDLGATLTNTNVPGGVNQLINQQANAAVYNWDSFNIAHGSSVYFNMAQGSGARALNRVMGSSDPSVIQGVLGSNGQVYLINQNGILFGAGAQVNVGGLVASALNVDTNDFLSGLQSINSPAPTFFYDGSGNVPFSGLANANVMVENGASLNSPSGRIFLFGGQVTNAGHISAADGQVGLAAGSEIYLAVPSVANLRGLLIDVTKAGTAAPAPGTTGVTNTETGVIETARGNTTLASYFVNQLGRISATTSATANGSIYLQARDSVNAQVLATGASANLPDNTLVKVAGRGGELILGSSSVTEILPDTNGVTTDNTKTFYTSSVDLSGRLIDMKSGASIVATGGQVTAAALASFDPVTQRTSSGDLTGTQKWSDLVLNGKTPVAQDNARFVMESGASIDVSGAQNVSIAMERNSVTTALLGASDLKDAPLQRDGILYRGKVSFDIRDPVPILGDTSAYANAIQRGAAEKLSAGGTIKLMSSGDMALAKGATLDISGGSLAYQGGYVNSTKLVSGGKVYDINSAPKDLVYDSIYGSYTVLSPKFGGEATRTWSLPSRGVYEPGYIEGKNAGSISLVSRSISTDATIHAGVVSGPLQRDAGSLPLGGAFNIGLSSDPASASGSGIPSDFVGPDIRIAAQGVDLSAAFWADPANAAPGAVGSQVVLGVNTLNDAGLGSVGLYTNGNLSQDAGANLKLAPGGSFTAIASSAALGGNIQAQGGKISVTTQGTSSHAAQGDIVVGGVLDTSGGWVNDTSAFNGSVLPTAPILVNGGTISLQGNGIDIQSQATLDVSGGAQLTSAGKLNLGNGGRIVLASAGTSIDSSGKVKQANGAWLNGALQIDGQLLGAAPGAGGSLALGLAAPVRIGGTAAPGEVGFDTGFFGRGGFADYTIASINGMTVSAGTQLAPHAQTLNFTGDVTHVPTGSAMNGFTSLGARLDGQPAPVNLNLQAVGATSGNLVVESGANINSDTGASVTLVAGRQLTVNGGISAPAGAINLILRPGDSNSSANNNLLDRSIWLGSQSVLSTAGVYVPSASSNGLRTGKILNGGTISIDLTQGVSGDSLATGMLVAQQGAVMDVRGASATLDLPAVSGAAQSVLVGSSGGSINIKTFDGGVLDATMLASGGTPGASGGQFNASIAGFNTASSKAGVGAHVPTGQQSVVLSDGSVPLVPAGAQPGGVLDRAIYGGKLGLRADTLNQAGFAGISLSAENSIRANNTLTLKTPGSIILNSPNIDVAAGAAFGVTAPYVKISNVTTGDGQGLAPPAATGGSGSLAVNASLIDLQGNVSLTGVGNTALNSRGDVRFEMATQNNIYSGAFNSGGDLSVTAAQAYPTTGFAGNVDPANPLNWSFNLNASGHTITFASNGAAAPTPLSAGGSLLVNAANIVQNGVLRAPLGRISLVADQNLTLGAGSLTSVAANGLVIPYGSTLNGQSWTYGSLSTADGNLSEPSKTINLSGANVTLTSHATVDVSGGGDLYGYEFVPGTGGSIDVLANSNAYAIVPSLGKAYAPYDAAYISSSNTVGGAASTLKVGDTITLAGGGGLAAGTYTLLPARYALLPGAYLVTPKSGYQVVQPGTSLAQADGSAIVAGYRGTLNNDTRDSLASGWLVESGAVVRKQAQYNNSFGNSFFSSLAANAGTVVPRNGIDAGIISINAGQSLVLDAALGLSEAVGGRGAAVDIASSKIAVTDATPGLADSYKAQGYLVLDAAKLDAAGIESLMLGGSRTGTGVTTTTATDVVIDSAHTALSGGDVILTARNNVSVAAGSAIVSSKVANADALQVSGAGALVRVAGNDSATVTRTGATPGNAALTIGANTRLGAANPGDAATLVLDSTNATVVDASASLRASTAVLSAGNISIGAVPGGAPGLALGSGLLGQLGQTHDLTLRSYSSIDFYGNASLGSTALDRLTLDTYALAGRGANPAANITAGQVTLTNTSGASTLSTASQPLGSGDLQVTASNDLIVGTGAKTLQGFANVNLAAGRELSLRNDGTKGTATLAASGSAPSQATALTITAARISGASGADQAISTTGQLTLQGNAASGTLGAPTGLGAKLALSGKSVNDAGIIDLPAGSINISATGSGSGDNVVIANGALLRAAGVTKTFAGLDTYAAAGQVGLQAAGGNVQINSGARVDVSGAAGGGNAGVLNATALNGTVQIAADATLKGNSATGYRSGTASLEAQTLGQLDAANTALNNGGFAEERDFRAHTGNLAVGTAVNARNVSLEADGGAVSIAGNVGGAYAKAGEVRVTSATGVALTGSGQLVAKATDTGAAGGTVYVATTSAANNNLSIGGQGVDVGGGAGGSGGTLWLRAPQDNQMGAVAAISGPVAGASTTVLEGYKTYSYNGNVNITGTGASNVNTNTLAIGNAATAGTILGDAALFMNNAAAINARVGNGQTATQVRAGTEVVANALNSTQLGDINISSALNFFPTSAANTRPEINGGVLTLRAQNNINVSAGISDGFGGATPALATAATAVLQVGSGNGTGPSNGAPTWSYHMAGGADLGAADTRRTLVNSAGGDVVIGKAATDVIVRTATGNIEIEAGRNVQLLNSQAVVYTTGAGTSLDATSQFGAISATGVGTVLGPSANPFTSGGGAIRLEAKNDVVGPASDNQAVTNWLFRQQKPDANNPQTAWWSRYDLFRQGVATFGGGDVTVHAGHDIKDFSASAATSARLPADAGGMQKTLVVNGGGDLDIQAGHNIAGGMYFESRGTATLDAGGSLSTGTAKGSTSYNPILALQDSVFNISAVGDLGISDVFNPTIATPATTNAFRGFLPGTFSSYSDTAAVNAQSLNGNVKVDNLSLTAFTGGTTGTANAAAPASNGAGAGLSVAAAQAFSYKVNPGTLNAVAFSGDVSAESNMMPSPQGNLNLLAEGGTSFFVTMMDRPASGTDSLASITNATGLRPFSQSGNDTRGYGLTHLGDTTPARIVGLTGDVATTLSSFIGKATQIIAGRDVKNLDLNVENVNPDDITLVSAGRDYIGAAADAKGQPHFAVDGPGQVLVQAGRNVDLGISDGLVTRGNTVNRFLDSSGASLTVMAGVSGTPDYSAMSGKYLGQYGIYTAAYLALGDASIGKYLGEITAFVRQNPAYASVNQWQALDLFVTMAPAAQAPLMTQLAAKNSFIASLPSFRQFLSSYASAPDTATATAIAQFQALPQARQQPFLQRLLFAELGNATSTAAKVGSQTAKDAAYQLGYDAIATLFPGSTYKGDLLMYSSQIKTQGGGDISIFAPGGMVNAGLVIPSATLAKSASNLGILTVAGGDINAVVKGDLLVNQSRVFTLAGGGILIWSSDGNIDTGRGAKTAASAPAPVLRLDSQGNLTVDYSGAVSGSGIGTIITDPTIPIGDIMLTAPHGIINALDAPIRGGLIVIPSPIHGADNIQASSGTVGLPAQGAVSAPPPPPLSDNTRNVVDQVSQSVANMTAGSRLPTTNNVFVGFGE